MTAVDRSKMLDMLMYLELVNAASVCIYIYTIVIHLLRQRFYPWNLTGD